VAERPSTAAVKAKTWGVLLTNSDPVAESQHKNTPSSDCVFKNTYLEGHDGGKVDAETTLPKMNESHSVEFAS